MGQIEAVKAAPKAVSEVVEAPAANAINLNFAIMAVPIVSIDPNPNIIGGITAAIKPKYTIIF